MISKAELRILARAVCRTRSITKLPAGEARAPDRISYERQAHAEDAAKRRHAEATFCAFYFETPEWDEMEFAVLPIDADAPRPIGDDDFADFERAMQKNHNVAY